MSLLTHSGHSTRRSECPPSGEKPISLRNNRATRKDRSPFLEISGPSVAPARNQPDLESAFARTIFHDFHREVGTHRTFKGALIVVRFVWLYAGQPHLRSAKFTKWSANDPLLRKKLVSPHATPPRLSRRAHAKLDNHKERKGSAHKGTAELTPFSMTALRRASQARNLYQNAISVESVPRHQVPILK